MFIFNLNAVSSRSKKGETIGEYLLNRKSIDKYLGIMNFTSTPDFASYPEFQKMFNTFYGLNVSGGMNIKNFYSIFSKYEKEKAKKKIFAYTNIINDLYDPTIGTGRVEKSFASKMLHTFDPNEPIIDSVVLKKLLNDPDTAPFFEGIKKSGSFTVGNSIDLHNALKKCYYEKLIPFAKGIGYFMEFDKLFPGAKSISETKKIDFYLWAM